jgi:hypothetical protein
LKDEPAIMGWETGSKLNGVPGNWTVEIADFIKGELEAKQLVSDGIDSERLGGVAKLPLAEIEAKSVDYYTDHFYPLNPAMVVASATAAKAAGKVYYVGEYEHSGGELRHSCAQSKKRNTAWPLCTGASFSTPAPSALCRTAMATPFTGQETRLSSRKR